MQKSLLTVLLFFSSYSFVTAQKMNVDSLMQELGRAKEDTNKVNILKNLSGSLRFTDPAKAIDYGLQGVRLARKLAFDKGIAACYMNVSTGYSFSGNLDTALLYIDTALIYAHKVGDANRLGLAYLNRGDIYRQTQNLNQSLKDCETALKYADEVNNDDVRARVNQTIAAVYYRQDNYPQAVIYYDKASRLYRKNNNMRMYAIVLNNSGLVYKSTKDFSKAISVTQEAIRLLDSLHDITNLSLFNANLSNVYYQLDDFPQAEKYANKAMEYAVMQGNESQVATVNLNLADIYFKQNRIAESIAMANKAMPVFKADEDIESISITADILADDYAATGNFQKAYEYLRIHREASDSLAKQRYDEDIAAMQAKFKVGEKDKEIQLLAKDKNLQEQKIKEQRILVIASVALALLALIGIWLAVNRYRLRQRMKELELRNRIAADLHDEVGSSLSSIHMLSQMANNNDEQTRKDILSRMSNNAKETMDKMSDIVWMIKPGETEAGSLKQRIERFTYEVCNSMNIEPTLELDELEKVKLSMEQRKNIYLVFKEALNNAAKYSGTNKIEIKVDKHDGQLDLVIKDDGKGFDTAIAGRGNGLQNMKNRANELGGSLLISSGEGKGTTVRLITPLRSELRTN